MNTTGIPSFSGDRLLQARKARGLFMTNLAPMVGVSRQQLSDYENGRAKPSEGTLQAIARTLGFPARFFLIEPPKPVAHQVFWRSRRSETKTAREMTGQRIAWTYELLARIEAEVQLPEVDLPDLDLPSDFRMLQDDVIEATADAARRAWRLGTRAISDVTLVLENAGIPVSMIEIPSDKQDGFLFLAADDRGDLLERPILGVNVCGASAARARFDVAHELGHLLLHRRVREADLKLSANHKMIEDQANRFASAFLFPREAFLDSVHLPSLEEFLSLKKHWGFSIAAMVQRAYALEMIDDDRRQSLFISMARRRWRGRGREPYDDQMPIERPRMLRRALETLEYDGGVRRQDLLREFALPGEELIQICGLDEDYFQNKVEPFPLRMRAPRNDAQTEASDAEVIDFFRRGSVK